ncbi:MAG: aryl-sulfate sulfotransferase [Candidatus Hodarchaeota archaeon]
MVVNSIENNSPCKFNDKITPTQLLNEITPNLISRKETEANGLEESTYTIHSGKSFDGYNAFQFRDFLLSHFEYRITDMNGNIVNKFWSRNTYGYGHQINSTTFLVVAGPAYLWNIETGKNTSLPLGSHHDISYNPITKTFMTMKEVKVDYEQHTYRIDSIRETNMAGDILWELNTTSFIPFEWWDRYREYDGSIRDITHSNSLFWDIEEDMIYLLCRNLNTFFKISHSTGEVIWGLGEFGNFTLFNHEGKQRQNLFNHAHALEKVDDNTFILFDNDYLNLSDLQSPLSQMLEITIDEATMTANTSWFWKGTPEYYSAYWGDADRLPTGNRFGTFGATYHRDTDIGPRLVEVNESGQIVWEMYYKGGSLGIYKAERFRLNPTLSSPEDKVVEINEDISLSWQTWSSFRARYKMNGSYILYQDGQAIDAGEITFNKFWLPTNLTFVKSPLGIGDYNFTLVIYDEGGHITKDSVNVTVYYPICREGATQIELGQENGIIQWTGLKIPPMTGKLYINNFLKKTFVWDGSIVEFDLNSLEPGRYNISLQIFNGSKTPWFSDTFWTTIHSPSPPEIINGPKDFWVWSNQTSIRLKWEVHDISPKNYSIYINDKIIESGSWDGSDIIFYYDLTTDGEILITLILYDILGYSAEDKVIIEVRAVPTSTTNSTNSTNSASSSFIGFVLSLVYIYQKKRKKS